ncbi:tetratricopeptide repeat protein [Nostoc sp. TCL240-02]|uniref:tetratricopeptide repeat protein n=1 Tax=Nostoc sp. TCL240-02 TaxID=2572090 RepID=UPI00157FA7BF|nr:tetratricopeptide repeat protein [Nostoc sp. TCL240-02]QKQ73152.1 tetratricopeptide repeat protein [Nostoc sp. TCL240-02]
MYGTDLPKLQTPKVVINPTIPEVPIWKGRDELINQLQVKLLHSENLLKVLVLVGQGGIGKTSLAVKLLDALGVNCRSLPTKSENSKRCPYECIMYFKVHEGTTFDDVAKFLLIDGYDWDIYFSPLIAIDIEKPAELTNIKNISQTEQIVECLIKSSLVQESYDEEKCEKIYDLHRVIIEFLQAEYQEEMQHILKIAYNLYSSNSNVDNPKTLEDIHYLLEAQHFAFRLEKYDKSVGLLKKLSIPYLRRWGYWNLIINLYEEVLPYSSKLNQPYVHLEIGNAYFQCGNLGNAEKHFNAALNSEDNWKKSSYLASCFYSLGKIEFVRGNYENAEYKYKEALRLWKELDQKLNITIIWSALGQIEENRGNLNEAEILYNKALQLRQDLKNDEGIAISLTSLGDIELKKGNLDKAKEDYQQALRIHIELGTCPRIAHLYCSLGYIQYKLSNWDEAKTFYQQSLSFYKELDDNSGIAISTGCLGKNELRDGNLNEAEKLLKQALDKMQELEMTEHFAKTNYYLAYLERQRGNQDLAQYYYNRGYEVFHQLGKLKDLENIENEWTQDLSQ